MMKLSNVASWEKPRKKGTRERMMPAKMPTEMLMNSQPIKVTMTTASEEKITEVSLVK